MSIRAERLQEAERLRLSLEQLGALVDFGEIDDLDELISWWDRFDKIRDTAAVLARSAGSRAARKLGIMAETQGPGAIGAVHTASNVSTKWDGHSVLVSLVQPMVDPQTGETMLAVPLDTLMDVLPAVGEGQTSSKWKKSGLKKHKLDPEKYVTTEYGPLQLRRGPRPKR